MIPSAEAARNTDDLRISGTLGNGAEGGGCGEKHDCEMSHEISSEPHHDIIGI